MCSGFVDIFIPDGLTGVDLAQYCRLKAYRGATMPLVAVTACDNVADWPCAQRANRDATVLSDGSFTDPNSAGSIDNIDIVNGPRRKRSLGSNSGNSTGLVHGEKEQEQQQQQQHQQQPRPSHLDAREPEAALNLFDGALLKPLTLDALAPLLARWILPVALGPLRRQTPITTLRGRVGATAFKELCSRGGVRGLFHSMGRQGYRVPAQLLSRINTDEEEDEIWHEETEGDKLENSSVSSSSSIGNIRTSARVDPSELGVTSLGSFDAPSTRAPHLEESTSNVPRETRRKRQRVHSNSAAEKPSDSSASIGAPHASAAADVGVEASLSLQAKGGGARSPAIPTDSRKLCVVVADDSPVQRKLFARHLRDALCHFGLSSPSVRSANSASFTKSAGANSSFSTNSIFTSISTPTSSTWQYRPISDDRGSTRVSADSSSGAGNAFDSSGINHQIRRGRRLRYEVRVSEVSADPVALEKLMVSSVAGARAAATARAATTTDNSGSSSSTTSDHSAASLAADDAAAGKEYAGECILVVLGTGGNSARAVSAAQAVAGVEGCAASLVLASSRDDYSLLCSNSTPASPPVQTMHSNSVGSLNSSNPGSGSSGTSTSTSSSSSGSGSGSGSGNSTGRRGSNSGSSVSFEALGRTASVLPAENTAVGDEVLNLFQDVIFKPFRPSEAATLVATWVAPRCANHKRPVLLAPFQNWLNARNDLPPIGADALLLNDHGDHNNKDGGSDSSKPEFGSSSSGGSGWNGRLSGRSALISNGVVGGVISHLSKIRHADASSVGAYDEHQEL
jgi:hypothetical protein